MRTTRGEQHVMFWGVVLALVVLALFLFREILLPFVVALAIAFFLNPVADAMERKGVPRGIAAALLVGVAGAAFIGAVLLFGPPLANQAKALALSLPADIERLRAGFEAWSRERLGVHFPAAQTALEKALSDLQANWASTAGTIAGALLTRGLAIVNLVSLLLITPLVVFYLLIDWNRMLERVVSWLPRDHVPTIAGLAHDINAAIAAFVRGQGAICVFLGIFYAAGLSLAGLQYGMVVGLATGLLAFVPVVGWAVGLVTALALAVQQFGFAIVPLATVAGVLIAGMALDTAVLSPRFVGERIGLHPVWLIFALFAFSYLFGLVGTLVAVPLAAACGVIMRHALKAYLASDVYLGEAARRGSGGAPGGAP